MVNAALVEEGYALALPRTRRMSATPSGSPHARRKAQEAARGLWGVACEELAYIPHFCTASYTFGIMP